MIRVLFLTRSLSYGGVQRQLTELVRAMDKSRFIITVATFYDGGMLWPEMASVDSIRLISLSKQGRYDFFLFASRLIRLVRDFRPHVIQTQNASNEFALLVRLFQRCRLIFGIGAAYIDWARYGWLEPQLFRLNARLAHHADLLIANSYAGKEHYARNGYPRDRIAVVNNGFDTARFHPARDLGEPLRRKWGVSSTEILLGIVGRLDFMKDHQTFLHTAAIVAAQHPRARFVCVGDGQPAYRASLEQMSDSLGLGQRVIWAGALSDMTAVYNSLDLCALTSYGEGLPNVVGEAMACGVPCTVTDVGDSALLVGDPDRVAPPRRPDLIAGCWQRLLDLSKEERNRIGLRDRQRIVQEFSVERLARHTEALLAAVVDGVPPSLDPGLMLARSSRGTS